MNSAIWDSAIWDATILSSPTCRSVNEMNIFNSALRRKRSHGHHLYTSPIFHDVSLNDLLRFKQKPLGMHHICSKLFSLPLSNLHALYNSCLVNNVTNPNSTEYKLTAIVLDIAGHRLFKPVWYCYEFAVTRNHVCLHFEILREFSCVLCKQNHLTTGWQLSWIFEVCLFNYVYLIYYLIANCIMHLFICNPSHSS